MNQNISNNSTYYHRFKIVIGTPLWRLYLRWAYRTCINDLKQLNFTPNFSRETFTALLCGVGNETTADEFIKFIIKRNKIAKIIIIDFGKEQIDAVTKLVQNRYSHLNIIVKKINALELVTFLKGNTIDWIETDGFLGWFDKKNLQTLLTIWKKLLKKDGFITMRDCASGGVIGTIIDYLKIWIAKQWLGITIYRHTKAELEKMFKKQHFAFVSGPTPLPTFKRYAIVKNHKTL